MAESKKQKEVKFITSLALAVNGVDDKVNHIQLTIVQEVESLEFHAYMDVVDPSKVKIDESSVS